MPNDVPVKRTVLVLGSLHNSALMTTRLLGQAGHRVVLARDPTHPTTAFRSRHCAETWDCPPMRYEDRAFIDALVGFLATRSDIAAVFPVGDLDSVILARHCAALPEAVRVIMPDPKAVETCHDKIALMRLASQVGVPQTPYALAAGLDALVREAERVGYPCVVKPVDSELGLFDQKAVILPDARHLHTAFASWPAGHKGLIVQRFADGHRRDIYLLARGGRIARALQTRVIRTNRANGTGLVVEAVTVPLSDTLYGDCEKLMAALDYTGIAYVQFLYDPARDQSCLLEVNARLGVSYTITAHCGLDLPNLALRMAFDEPLPDLDTPFHYPIGRRYAWTYGDLTGLMRALSRREIGLPGAAAWLAKIPVSGLRADTHVTWSWHDPMPTLASYGAMLRRWSGHAAGRA